MASTSCIHKDVTKPARLSKAATPSNTDYCGVFDGNTCVGNGGNCVCEITITPGNSNDFVKFDNIFSNYSGAAMAAYLSSGDYLAFLPYLDKSNYEGLKNYLSNGPKAASVTTNGDKKFYLFSENPDDLPSNPDVVLQVQITN